MEVGVSYVWVVRRMNPPVTRGVRRHHLITQRALN
jgi:hypothetical protein